MELNNDILKSYIEYKKLITCPFDVLSFNIYKNIISVSCQYNTNKYVRIVIWKNNYLLDLRKQKIERIKNGIR